MNKEVKITPAKEKDFDAVWRIFQQVIAGGQTYVNDENTTKENAYDKWFDKSAKTFVAKIGEEIVGAYLIRANKVGRGSHVANASYIVDENKRGFGIGKALATHSIETAKILGYKAIQFNFVVSTNIAAVNLWKSVGFRIIGTVPQGFKHQSLGFVDAYIMFREL